MTTATAARLSLSQAHILHKVRRWLGQQVLPVHLVAFLTSASAHGREGDATPRINDVMTEAFQDALAALVQYMLAAHTSLTHSASAVVYFQTVLKLLIRQLEKQGVLVSEAMTECYAELIMSTPIPSASAAEAAAAASAVSTQATVVSYYYTADDEEDDNNEGKAVHIHESPNVISANGSTGHRTWEAALALADFLLTSPHVSTKQVHKVVELGAGTGLTGLVAARVLSPASRVILTDGDDLVVQNLRANIALNPSEDSKQEVTATRLLWGTDPAIPDTDLVLAADVTYDSTVIPYLVAALAQFLQLDQPIPPTVLVAATIRSEDTFAVFEQECLNKAIKLVEARVYKQPVSSDWFYIAPTSPEIRIYSLHPLCT